MTKRARPDPGAWGVCTEYEDQSRRIQTAPPETIDALLDSMGADGPTPPDAPVRVVTHADGARFPESELHLEDGTTTRIDGTLPTTVPFGYHILEPSRGERVDLIVSPGACFLPPNLRTWGWAVQLYALRSEHSWGIGDLGDLRALLRWASGEGAGATMINPLHAANPGPSQQASPYYPSSRLYRNPLYLRIEEVPGAREVLGGVDVSELNATALIDRDRVYDAKVAALTRIWEAGPRPAADFDAYASKEGDALAGFATFVSLVEQHGTPDRWPAPLRDPASSSVAAFRREQHDRVQFHSWVQWVLDRQVADAASHGGLINDLAIGVDPSGADAWMWSDAFAAGATVGAPPDEFNLAGQDWGLPPFDPWRLRAQRYEPFVRTVRASLRYAAGLRIDHVMGLFRLFWIPAGGDPNDGAYVRYPAEDLLNIVALESHRAAAFIVGEDLGTVEPAVREAMTARSMLSCKLLWFEDDPPERWPELSLGAVTNHDLPTVAGLWSDEDLAFQKDIGLEPNVAGAEAIRRRVPAIAPDRPLDEVVRAVYKQLAAAKSHVVLATLEDALQVRERPNYPGTGSPVPNWARPLPTRLEDLVRDPRASALARELRRGREN